MSQVDMPYLETPDDWSTLRFDILNLGEGVELVTSSGDGDRKLEGLRIHKSRRYTFMQDQIKWVI